MPGALVEVLLATYQGELYLREQIESILAQDYPDTRILARDDGSTDSTRAILEHYARTFPGRFTLLPAGEPSGGAKWNFLHLMQASTAEYLALADQDDVWLPTKIGASMAALHALEQTHPDGTPLLVFSDLRIVDEHLRVTAPSFWKHQDIDPSGIHELRRLVTQNVLTGCTALFNRPLCQLADRMAPETPMHDWWIALTACLFGASAFLREPTVLYRQHAANVVGAIEHGTPRMVPRFRDHTMRRIEWERTERQARALLRVYAAELSPRDRDLLTAYSLCETSPSRLIRVFTLVRHRFFRKSLRVNLAVLWYLWDMQAARREQAR